MFKVVTLATLFAAANAGILGQTPLAYTAPAPFAYNAPLAYAPPAHYGYSYSSPAAHVSYAVPYGAHAAPLAYAAPTIAKVAAPVAYAAPAAHFAAAPVVAKTVVAEEYDANPQYSYAYNIQDGLTGDSKDQHETRNGDLVQGSYSLNDADGYRRIVDYTADPLNGFNAVVRREPLGAAPIALAAPVAKIHPTVIAA